MKKFEKIDLGLKEAYEELFMNEMYAKDISKKIRSAQRIKGNSGGPLSQPPYGYMKHPDDCNKWIVVEEAAAVVRRICRLTLEGKGKNRRQCIIISYRYMGVIDIPQQFHGDNVTIDTREGVCVEYLPVTKKKADPKVCRND